MESLFSESTVECKFRELHGFFYTSLQIEDREFLVRVSYMEIYNEEINDLLAPDNRKLQIHESVEVAFDLLMFLA